MPDPNANPNAKLPSIAQIQEACAKAGARLVFLPEGVDIDDTAVQFELANGRELKVPVKQLLDIAIDELVDRLTKAGAK